MYVVPVPVAVTTPLSSTVAIWSSCVLYSHSPFSTSSYNKLNPAVTVYSIFSPVSPAFL